MFLIGEKANAPFATIWGWDDQGKYTKVRLSTSEKNQDGEYENSSWLARFVGKAHEKISDASERDRIKILSGKINNISRKQDDGSFRSFLNVVVFDFEFVDQNNDSKPAKSSKWKQQQKSPVKKQQKKDDYDYDEDQEDDTLPF
jgi:hypothetical protein